MRNFWLVPAVLLLVAACKAETHVDGSAAADDPTVSDVGPPARALPDDPAEPHLRNLRQLTFGGENAEAYWSWGGDRLIFQMRGRNGIVADQIYIMAADGSGEHMVSDGTGKTTCSFFLPGDREIVYASTRHLGAEPPAQPPATPGKYTWPLFDYEIWHSNADGTNLRRLTENKGYDAEPTVGPDGRIVFTSEREGDLDIYTMAADGTDVRRLTSTPGYDGGAFFSRDGKRICYRAYHPADAAGLAEFRSLLASHRVQPTVMDIWVMNADGSDQHQVTHLGGASFAPYFHPDGERILFATNFENPRGRNFDLYLINVDGSGLERVTASPEFDCFPMFSPDGKQLAFSSNRGGSHEGDTNLFVAEWVE